MPIFAYKILHIVSVCMKIIPRIYIGLLVLLLFLSGCSVSKFIPEGHYLLDNVKVESDNKEIKPSQMNMYLRQTPNAKWFSLVKLPMYIYGAAERILQSGLTVSCTVWEMLPVFMTRTWRKKPACR